MYSPQKRSLAVYHISQPGPALCLDTLAADSLPDIPGGLPTTRELRLAGLVSDSASKIRLPECESHRQLRPHYPDGSSLVAYRLPIDTGDRTGRLS